MTNQEAIETIKANYPPENYSMLREALDIALELMKQEQCGNGKRHKVPKDCLSCAQSFSADDDDGNMILICVKDHNHHVQVQEGDSCEEWKN